MSTKGECYIQCKATAPGAKVEKGIVAAEFNKYGGAKDGIYRAYIFITNTEFTGPAKNFLESKKADGWAVSYIEHADIGF